jgi:hypothetical protein
MGLTHQATVPWPANSIQQDWVDQVWAIELWLESFIGAKDQRWTWVDNTECAAIAFARAQDATLFTLRWTS